MTEGNTTRTLHNDSWEYILTVLDGDSHRHPNGKAEAIIATINAQQ